MALVLSFLISYQQYRERSSFLKKELDTIVTAKESIIEQSLWIKDTRALVLVMKGFLLNSDIVYSQITDENEKTVVSNGMPGSDNVIKKQFLFITRTREGIYSSANLRLRRQNDRLSQKLNT